jgi:hypothetical protein
MLHLFGNWEADLGTSAAKFQWQNACVHLGIALRFSFPSVTWITHGWTVSILSQRFHRWQICRASFDRQIHFKIRYGI